MKISAIIISLSFLALSACQFSYDKAKVEEGYGSGGGYDTGGGGGGGEISKVYVNAKVCLESAFNPTYDITDLTSYLMQVPAGAYALSSTTPYNGFGGYTGSDSIAYYGTAPAIDWILVQLVLDTLGDGSVKSIVETKSALLLADGTIKAADGSEIYFDAAGTGITAGGKYFINILHRNHLAVGSAESKLLTSDSTTTPLFDFTDDSVIATTQYLSTGSSGLVIPYKTKTSTSPNPGVARCLYAGDLDFVDGNTLQEISATDVAAIETIFTSIIPNYSVNLAVDACTNIQTQIQLATPYNSVDVDFSGVATVCDLSSAATGDYALIFANIGSQSYIHTP